MARAEGGQQLLEFFPPEVGTLQENPHTHFVTVGEHTEGMNKEEFQLLLPCIRSKMLDSNWSREGTNKFKFNGDGSAYEKCLVILRLGSKVVPILDQERNRLLLCAKDLQLEKVIEVLMLEIQKELYKEYHDCFVLNYFISNREVVIQKHIVCRVPSVFQSAFFAEKRKLDKFGRFYLKLPIRFVDITVSFDEGEDMTLPKDPKDLKRLLADAEQYEVKGLCCKIKALLDKDPSTSSKDDDDDVDVPMERESGDVADQITLPKSTTEKLVSIKSATPSVTAEVTSKTPPAPPVTPVSSSEKNSGSDKEAPEGMERSDKASMTAGRRRRMRGGLTRMEEKSRTVGIYEKSDGNPCEKSFETNQSQTQNDKDVTTGNPTKQTIGPSDSDNTKVTEVNNQPSTSSEDDDEDVDIPLERETGDKNIVSKPAVEKLAVPAEVTSKTPPAPPVTPVSSSEKSSASDKEASEEWREVRRHPWQSVEDLECVED